MGTDKFAARKYRNGLRYEHKTRKYRNGTDKIAARKYRN